jgi:hypothetical protein
MNNDNDASQETYEECLLRSIKFRNEYLHDENSNLKVPFNCLIPNCGKSYCNQSTFMTHLRTHVRKFLN